MDASNIEKRPKKLLDQVRDAIKLKHYSSRTGESYIYWINVISSFIINAMQIRWASLKSWLL